MSSEVNAESNQNLKDDFPLRPKGTPKIIRILTVSAYVLCISLAAILLSIYYIFVWHGKPHLGARVQPPNIDPNNVTHEHLIIKPAHLIQVIAEFNSTVMQRQVVESKDFKLPTTPLPSIIIPEIDDTTIWPEYGSEVEEFKKSSSPFIKKLIYNEMPYNENSEND